MDKSRKTQGVEAILSGENRSPAAGGLRLLTQLGVPFYAGGVALRNAAYSAGLKSSRAVHCPVISIGNLTTGGTGKTPMVIHAVETLLEAGHHPAVIMRGYRASAESGSDEAKELRERFADETDSIPPVIANPDRIEAAAQVQSDHPEVDALVLDDAFQHRQIDRDLDVVLIDATNPFGYGHMLPRGLMRESPRALRRADVVVVTRSDRVDASELARLDQLIERYHGRPPLAHAIHQWERFLDHHDQHIHPDQVSVLAVCGIGNPTAFFNQAAETVAISATLPFPDHHDFSEDDLSQIIATADRLRVSAILLTEKDWVKLREKVHSLDLPVPIWRPRLSIGFLDGGREYQQRLCNVIQQARRS